MSTAQHCLLQTIHLLWSVDYPMVSGLFLLWLLQLSLKQHFLQFWYQNMHHPYLFSLGSYCCTLLYQKIQHRYYSEFFLHPTQKSEWTQKRYHESHHDCQKLVHGCTTALCLRWQVVVRNIGKDCHLQVHSIY